MDIGRGGPEVSRALCAWGCLKLECDWGPQGRNADTRTALWVCITRQGIGTTRQDCPRQKAGESVSDNVSGMCQTVEVEMQAVYNTVRSLLWCPVGEE